MKAPTFWKWLAALLALWLVIVLCGCDNTRAHASRIDEHTTITRVMDFSSMLPALDLLCAIGIAASIAALIWIPIQKWIPLAGITFFGSLIVIAYSVAWMIVWLPYLIGAGFLFGALWTIWHFRGLILGVRRGWNEPQDSPTPPAVAKVLLP